MYLLDVNLLIAVCDRDHEHHQLARHWLRAHCQQGWATCPITENALLRIMGSSSYPGGPGSPEGVRSLLQLLRSSPGHAFIGDTLSLGDQDYVPSLATVAPKGLTDIYLLALAVSNKANFATLDRKIDPTRVIGGESALVTVQV